MNVSTLIEQAKNKVNEKEFDAALVILNQVLENYPKEQEAIYERAVIYSNINKFELAVFDFNQLLEIEPSRAFYYSCRAFVKAKLADTNGAIADYQKAVELDPDDAVTYNNLGLLQEQQGYKSKAEKNFEKSNKIIGYQPNRLGEGVVKEDKVVEDIPEVVQSKSAIIKSIFSDKKVFKEFLNFIKNGFKIKSDD